MRGFNLAKFKKMKEDKQWATLIHEDGHQLVIAKAPLSHLQRKQLENLDTYKFAEGGMVPHYDQGGSKGDLIDYANADYSQTPDSASYGSGSPLQYQVPDQPQAPVSQPTQQSVPISIPGVTPDAQSRPSVSSAAEIGSNPSINSPTNSSTPPMLGQAQNAGLTQEQNAYTALAQARGAEGQAEAKAIGNAQAAQSELPTQQSIVDDYGIKDKALMNAYNAQKLDPTKYWQDHSKVTAGIGVLLSGLGQAVGAGHVASNGALDAIENGINRELESQRNEQGKALNAWQMNRQALGTDLAANLATKNQLYTGLQYSLQKAAADAKSPIALQEANVNVAKIQQMKDANTFKLSLLNPTSDNPDPASRIQLLGIPQERQQKVVDEINAAKNTVANAPGIMQAFDLAAKDARPLSGGLSTSPSILLPGKTPGQQALQARLGPTFQDVEGTVRQAAMDNLDHNITPKFGDNDSTIAVKRQSLTDYLRSKSAASASKSFGLDLSRFPSTNTSNIGGSTSSQNGVQYERRIINGKPYRVPVRAGS